MAITKDTVVQQVISGTVVNTQEWTSSLTTTRPWLWRLGFEKLPCKAGTVRSHRGETTVNPLGHRRIFQILLDPMVVGRPIRDGVPCFDREVRKYGGVRGCNATASNGSRAVSQSLTQAGNRPKPLPCNGTALSLFTSVVGKQRSVTKKQRSVRVLTRVLKLCLQIFSLT